jgi:hypothetical protein
LKHDANSGTYLQAGSNIRVPGIKFKDLHEDKVRLGRSLADSLLFSTSSRVCSLRYRE